jgi:hypothetical protein
LKGGRQIKGGETAQPADKVVRLPRDWLGPREDLVPFGPGASAPEPESDASAPSPEAPPTAADFWGERSAAVQAPADEAIEADARFAAPRRRRVFGTQARRQVAAVTGLAVAAAAVVWVMSGVLGPSGSAPHAAGTAKLNMAAVLSNGVSRTLQRGLALVGASAGRSQTPPAARHRVPAVRRIARPRPVFKPVHETAHSQLAATANSAPPAPPTVVRSSPPTTVQTYAPEIVSGSRPTVHRSTSSAASVSPTGESGALGPIQSPNG